MMFIVTCLSGCSSNRSIPKDAYILFQISKSSYSTPDINGNYHSLAYIDVDGSICTVSLDDYRSSDLNITFTDYCKQNCLIVEANAIDSDTLTEYYNYIYSMNLNTINAYPYYQNEEDTSNTHYIYSVYYSDGDDVSELVLKQSGTYIGECSDEYAQKIVYLMDNTLYKYLQ